MTALRYMLDTNIASDLIRHPTGIVARRVRAAGDSAFCISIITAAELRFGAAKRGAAWLNDRVDGFLSAIAVVAPDAPFDEFYAEIRVFLERSGQPIGPNDLLIAAHARALNLTLITANLREFTRVPSLVVENWLA